MRGFRSPPCRTLKIGRRDGGERMVSIRQLRMSGPRGAACIWGGRGAGPAEEAADAALLRAGQAGDRAAVEALVARHKRSLFGLCYGILRHADDAEDAVQ